MMEIRPTEIKDLPLVMEIYDYSWPFLFWFLRRRSIETLGISIVADIAGRN